MGGGRSKKLKLVEFNIHNKPSALGVGVAKQVESGAFYAL